jgi:hypothetical protein
MKLASDQITQALISDIDARMKGEGRRRLVAKVVSAALAFAAAVVLVGKHWEHADLVRVLVGALLGAVVVSVGENRYAWRLFLMAAFLAIFARRFPGDGVAAALGVKCAIIELGAALLAAVPVLFVVQMNRDPPKAAPLCLSAAAGALAAAAALHVACSASGAAAHVFVFHLLPIFAVSVFTYGIAMSWRRSLQQRG